MEKDKFSFGVTPRMREVPPGEHAVIKFTADPVNVETDWGTKLSFPILILKHPGYQSLKAKGLKTTWETKSSCAYQIASALDIGTDNQHKEGYDPKASKEFKKRFFDSEWKLIRTEEGTYFIEEL